jgi:hypothetical protein
LLHKKCGSRLRNRIFYPVCNQTVERQDLIRGFEYSKGQCAKLTENDLETLEAEANRSIDLKEFVPILKIDPVYFESSYYLGPDEGGEKPYRLLADALAKTQRAAVAELVSRGKEQIVIIRPYRGGLVLHGMYYEKEIRDTKTLKIRNEAEVALWSGIVAASVPIFNDKIMKALKYEHVTEGKANVVVKVAGGGKDDPKLGATATHGVARRWIGNRGVEEAEIYLRPSPGRAIETSC